MSDHIVRCRRFSAGVLVPETIFFDFWREKGAFTDPASSATFFCVAKLKVLLPRSMLLLLLQLLSWWAVSATAVPMARMHAGTGYWCYDDHGNQLSNSPPSPELSVSLFYCPDRAQRAF